MRKLTIVESYTEPNKGNLWFYGGTLKWFSSRGWEEINTQPQLPTTTTTTTQPPEQELIINISSNQQCDIIVYIQSISTTNHDIHHTVYPHIPAQIKIPITEGTQLSDCIVNIRLDNSVTTIFPHIGYYNSDTGELMSNEDYIQFTPDKYTYNIQIRFDVDFTTTTSTTEYLSITISCSANIEYSKLQWSYEESYGYKFFGSQKEKISLLSEPDSIYIKENTTNNPSIIIYVIEHNLSTGPTLFHNFQNGPLYINNLYSGDKISIVDYVDSVLTTTTTTTTPSPQLNSATITLMGGQ